MKESEPSVVLYNSVYIALSQGVLYLLYTDVFWLERSHGLRVNIEGTSQFWFIYSAETMCLLMLLGWDVLHNSSEKKWRHLQTVTYFHRIHGTGIFTYIYHKKNLDLCIR